MISFEENGPELKSLSGLLSKDMATPRTRGSSPVS